MPRVEDRRNSAASSLASSCGEKEELVVAAKSSARSTRRIGFSSRSFRSAVDDWKPPVHKKTAQEREEIRDLINKSSDSKLKIMFGPLSSDTFELVLDAMFPKRVAAKQIILREGDACDNFYIVKSGRVELCYSAEPQAVKVFYKAGPGFCFGEIGLLDDRIDRATVEAVTATDLWCMDSEAFRRLLVKASEEQFQQRVQFLKGVEIFAELSDAEIASLAEVVAEEDFEPDEAILEQGDRDSSMYILTEGSAVACIKGESGEKEVKEYGPGDYFGEIALLLGEVRKASVYAIGRVVCLSLSRNTFNLMLGPLRDVLKRDIAKYPQYHEILARPEDRPQTACSDVRRISRENLLERRLSGEMPPVVSNVSELYNTASIAQKKVRKLRDRSLIVESDAAASRDALKQSASADMTLAERIALDFENPALSQPDPGLALQGATLQVFGSWRLGEQFTFDKAAVAKTGLTAVSAEAEKGRWEDVYTWSASSWLQGSTHAAVLCQKGHKDGDPTPNQDNYFIVHLKSLQIYGVCDGHGPFGHLVSFRLVQSIPHFLTTNRNFEKDWELAFKEAFAAAQADLRRLASAHSINLDASGATATVLVFEGLRIHVAHVGDSSCMVGSWNRHDSRVVYGSEDHKPHLPGEKERLEKAGMEVREVVPEDESSSRIYLPGQKMPGLTMSRAFGDTVCRGLLQEPWYREIMLQPTDEYYAILASDGIWDFIPYDNALALTAKKLRLKGPRETVTFTTTASRKRWQTCCGTYCDDITCIIVKWNVTEKGVGTNQSLTVMRS